MASNRRDQMVRRGRWKLIVKAKAEPELFNLENDLGEQKNVAAEHPELVAELKQRLADVAARDNDSLANPRQP
jgi:arylsulfatase A-like enzyme